LALSRTISGSVMVAPVVSRVASLSRTVAVAVRIGASVVAARAQLIPFGPIVRFLRDRNPFPRAVREDRPGKF
jgi:hypothetical protein